MPNFDERSLEPQLEKLRIGPTVGGGDLIFPTRCTLVARVAVDLTRNWTPSEQVVSEEQTFPSQCIYIAKINSFQDLRLFEILWSLGLIRSVNDRL